MFVVNIPFVFGSMRFPAARSIKILSAASRHTKIKFINKKFSLSEMKTSKY